MWILGGEDQPKEGGPTKGGVGVVLGLINFFIHFFIHLGNTRGMEGVVRI